jgi:alpha-beta hydrolase superfamily lysophospholipase
MAVSSWLMLAYADNHRRSIMRASVALVVWLVAMLGAGASAQERLDLATRPGVTQPVYFTAAPSAVASVILFPGGIGVVATERNNFLLRVAGRFSAQGMNVAVADAPSDQGGGMSVPFRQSSQHADDIAAIVAMLRSRSPAPVWLVGTSRGSISAANGAVRIGPPRVAGVVLTSSVWLNGMAGIALEQIRVPVLVVHNHDDGCRESPFGETAGAMARMQQARVKELLALSGGSQRSGPCQALSPHGYYGIEDQVMPAIIAWIKGHS